MNKLVVISRGLPGSGKSTLSEKILNEFKERIPFALAAKYSTDDYFTYEGEYKFDGLKLSKAHEWNKARFRRALDNDYDLVIVDNTHCQFWEVSSYVEYALEKGYSVRFVEPNTEWKFSVDELVNRNIHSVPRTSIERMLRRWQTTEEVIRDCVEHFNCNVNWETKELF